jgi:hypothetical protein
MIRTAKDGASACIFVSLLCVLVSAGCDLSHGNVGDPDKDTGSSTGDGDQSGTPGNGNGKGDGDQSAGDGDPTSGGNPGGDGDQSSGDGDLSSGDGDQSSGDGDQSGMDAGQSGGDGDTSSGGDGDDFSNVPDDGLDWHQARMTEFTSYPDPGSDECVKFSGCEYEGEFAALDGQQSQEWVMMHNILAVHSRDFDMYKLKTLRLRSGDHHIDAVVYDECADKDCDGCCTRNASKTGYLIDVESYTAARFGVNDETIDWACLNCN